MSIVPAIILIVVAAIAGYVIGIVDSRITSSLQKKPGETLPDEPKKTDEHAVLKVVLDTALKWRMDLDGVRVEPDGLTAEQRTRLVNVIMQIRPWIDGKTTSVSAPTAHIPASTASRPAALAQPPPLPASASAITQPPPSEIPRVNVIRGFRSLLENEIKTPEAPPALSIVKLIDDVLQKKLAGTPLAAKKIRLEEGPLGEVIVLVGGNRYPDIDAVPDDEIKALIRSAVAEWDKK